MRSGLCVDWNGSRDECERTDDRFQAQLCGYFLRYHMKACDATHHIPGLHNTRSGWTTACGAMDWILKSTKNVVSLTDLGTMRTMKWRGGRPLGEGRMWEDITRGGGGWRVA